MENDNAVRVRGLVKRSPDKVAVDGVDLDIRRGEVFALLGPNGAGKTTTTEILEGYRRADEGEVSVLGTDPAHGDRYWRARLGIVAQTTRDEAVLSVAEMITHFAGYYPNPRDPADVIAAVGLEEKRKTRVRNLSGGQRRRLDVALGVIGNPELLFLDEPTTGFDPEARRQFWTLIEELRTEGTTILLTTHYLDEAAQLCDRVAVVDHGKVIALGTPRELIASLGAEHVVEFAVDREGVIADEDVRALPSVEQVAREDGMWRVTVKEMHRAVPALLAALAERGVAPTELTTHHATLEDVFMSLTGRRLRDG
jgi:ABC-2 type transport system ATP-binding protein